MGNQIVLPPVTPVPQTQYKNVLRTEMNAYYSLLRAYNAPFKRLAIRGPNNTVQLAPDYATKIYDPPPHLRHPPWVASEVDVLFLQDILTYQAQLVKILNNLNDGRMVRILNNPPEPQQPPSQFIKETTVVPTEYSQTGAANGAANGTTPLTIDQQVQQLSNDPGQQKYIKTWLEGIQYTKPGQDYTLFVKYNPPPKGANFATALRHYTTLYEQIRGFNAYNTGGEVFTLKFDPPTAPDGQGSFTENFVDTTSYTCVKQNTEREQWYLNQVIDIEGKRKLQAEFCKQKGLKYNTSGKCSLFECEQPDDGPTTEAPEPETGNLYLYNQIKFSGSQYPSFDNSDYSDNTELKNFTKIDIDKYYKRLATYNFNWLNNNGWRRLENNKLYTPPIPAWITAESATGLDKQFLNAIDEFNEQALEKLQRFNNYEPMNLPDDFGALPDMPPYPDALYKMLEKPQDYVVPAAIGTIPQQAASGKVFRIPVADLPKIYNSVKKQKPPPPPPKPKCSGKDTCILYDDDVSPAAQKLLDEMLKKKADRVSTVGYEYAMAKPQPAQEVVSAKLNSFYDSIRPEILKNIQNLLGK